MKGAAARAGAALIAALLLSVPASARTARAELDPAYAPARGVLEILATLRHHVPDDTYRFEPARDANGRNIYRVSLTRLENMEKLHREALQAGHMDEVIVFAKGRALERLRAYGLAAESYRRAARYEGGLQHEARRGVAACDGLAEAVSLGFEYGRPIAEGGRHEAPSDPEEALAQFEKRSALLKALLDDAGSTHYAAIIREELERSDMARAHYFRARRRLSGDGDVRTLSELQRVLTRHRESKNANRHMLALADLYADLADEYVSARPPESLWFDPPIFQDLVDGAARLYEVVANQDGTPEKLEAARRLEAFLAFTLRVDRDRVAE